MRRLTLLRIATDPPARICSGVNPVIIPPDAVESAEALYLGGGKLLSIPDLEQVINGISSRIEVGVSGVSAATVALFRDESASLQGADVDIGFAYLDDAYQVEEVEWLASLRCDSPTIDSQDSQGGRTRTIKLSIGSENSDRSRAPIAFWTDADQRRRSPTDRFFDHIAGISSGTSRRFGPSDA